MHYCGKCGKSFSKKHDHKSKSYGIESAGEANYLKTNYLSPKNKSMQKFWKGGLEDNVGLDEK